MRPFASVTLGTERMLLRPFCMEDTDDVFEYSKSALVGPAAGWKPHESRAETESILQTVFLGQEGVFAMEDRRSGHVIGSIGLIPDSKREYPHVRMLGYGLGDRWWGQGRMTEAAHAVLRYGFQTLELALISVTCYPDNLRSRRVIEKCGFVYEGTLRQAEQLWNGSVHDHMCFSLTREEYQRGLRAGHGAR